MKPTDALLSEHAVLRSKLSLLEGLLTLPQLTALPLHAVLSAIARYLRCHTEREGVLVTALHHARGGRPLDLTEHLADDHEDQRETLDILLGLLTTGEDRTGERVSTYAAHFIDELREHMEQEEARIFPLIDKALDPRTFEEMLEQMPKLADQPDVPGAADPSITEDMTVNHVLQLHPFARDIFRAFQIDCAVDGCHHLDELYWRRGIDVERLLEALHLTAATV